MAPRIADMISRTPTKAGDVLFLVGFRNCDSPFKTIGRRRIIDGATWAPKSHKWYKRPKNRAPAIDRPVESRRPNANATLVSEMAIGQLLKGSSIPYIHQGSQGPLNSRIFHRESHLSRRAAAKYDRSFLKMGRSNHSVGITRAPKRRVVDGPLLVGVFSFCAGRF